jgi:hypothetical protein
MLRLLPAICRNIRQNVDHYRRNAVQRRMLLRYNQLPIVIKIGLMGGQAATCSSTLHCPGTRFSLMLPY